MALMGAEALLYPTAIGSEPPPAPPVDSRDHWRRVMQGHAGANYVPLIASNRIGTEKGQAGEMTFYGSSFIADPTGEHCRRTGPRDEGVDHGRVRSGRDRQDARLLGPVPRPAAGALWRARQP